MTYTKLQLFLNGSLPSPLWCMSVTQELLETRIDSTPQKSFSISLGSKEKSTIKTPLPIHMDSMSKEDSCFLVTQEESIFLFYLEYDCAPDEEESSQPN